MSPGNICHRGTNYLTEKYVRPTVSLGKVAGEGIPVEHSPATSRWGFPSDLSLGKAPKCRWGMCADICCLTGQVSSLFMEIIPWSSSELSLGLEVATGDDGISSRNLFTDNELPSFVHTVVSDDNLLTEILLRLPILSLLFFKSVSKRWLALIKHINSTLRRTKNPNLDPPTGLFIQRLESPSLYDFVSLDSRIPSGIHPLPLNFNFLLNSQTRFFIVDSCNGLLLCEGVNQDNMIMTNIRCRGIYWNNAIHWLDNEPLHFKLDILNEHPIITKIQLPVTVDKKMPLSRTLFESRGYLLLLGVDHNNSQQFNIYEMSNVSSEWSVKSKNFRELYDMRGHALCRFQFFASFAGV
nr:hypothetical protein [Tanacetum cinerariifolium]